MCINEYKRRNLSRVDIRLTYKGTHYENFINNLFGVWLPHPIYTSNIHGVWSPSVRYFIHRQACFIFLLLRRWSSVGDVLVSIGLFAFNCMTYFLCYQSSWIIVEDAKFSEGWPLKKIVFYETWLYSISKAFLRPVSKKMCFVPIIITLS